MPSPFLRFPVHALQAAPHRAPCPQCLAEHPLPAPTLTTFSPAVPVANHARLACPSCGADMRFNDFGRLDGIKHMPAPRFAQLLARLRAKPTPTQQENPDGL